MNVKNRKAEQSAATRAALVKAARGLFATRGFAATATEDIVQAAGVTRGALYHQFRDKRDLFEAVYRDMETEIIARLASEVLAGGDPVAQLRHGARAYLDLCLDPEVRRIALTDAPSVLGWQRWRALDAEYGLGLLTAALGAAMDAGGIIRRPLAPLAHILLGALGEAAMVLASAEDQVRTREELSETLDRLLDGLLPAP